MEMIMRRTMKSTMTPVQIRIVSWSVAYKVEGHDLGVGTPDYPSGIPVMHTIHDPRKSVMNPHNRFDIKVTSSITIPG
jgi:hypothetical protein